MITDLARTVVGYDESGVEVCRSQHVDTDTPEAAAEQATRLTVSDSVVAYAVILDRAGYVVGHVGEAPCDRLWRLREGAEFTVRGRTYRSRSGSSEGWSYYAGDDRPGHGPRSEGYRVPAWLPSGKPGHVTVTPRTTIVFAS